MHTRQFAQLISRVAHPINIICLTLLIINSAAQGNALLGLIDTTILLLGLLPAILYLVTTRHTPTANQKYVAICLLLLGVAATIGIYAAGTRSVTQIRSLAVGIIGGIGITLIHRYWNISFHAATSMGCVALLIPISPPIASCIGILAVLAGLARLPIHEHTLFQVLAGWLYGFGVTAMLLILSTNLVDSSR
jgi:membrane-associated phospholipid phosphatase